MRSPADSRAPLRRCLAAHYSITLSARANNASATVTPIALAVFPLIAIVAPQQSQMCREAHRRAESETTGCRKLHLRNGELSVHGSTPRLSYRVVQDGKRWHWEVVGANRDVVARDSAQSSVKARAAAMAAGLEYLASTWCSFQPVSGRVGSSREASTQQQSLRAGKRGDESRPQPTLRCLAEDARPARRLPRRGEGCIGSRRTSAAGSLLTRKI
jgi:hypothetical protein